jgi:hypothetical protein
MRKEFNLTAEDNAQLQSIPIDSDFSGIWTEFAHKYGFDIDTVEWVGEDDSGRFLARPRNTEDIRIEILPCIGVKRLVGTRPNSKITEYLVCNGTFMGKWTSIFGANCIADTFDCKQFAQNIANETPNSFIFEIRVTYDLS